MLAAGYITTSLQLLFVALQLFAAATAPKVSASAPSGCSSDLKQILFPIELAAITDTAGKLLQRRRREGY
jgi:hypothetical protein